MLAKNVHKLITASKPAKPWGNERHLSKRDPCLCICAHAVGKTSNCVPYIVIVICPAVYVSEMSLNVM